MIELTSAPGNICLNGKVAVVFLASDAARMVSGATYDVTGGDTANNAT